MDSFAASRTKMVDSQLRTEGVTDSGLLAVMGSVPRELFVPPTLKPFAYIDNDIVLKRAGEPRCMMQPASLGRLLQLAEISSSDNALDVGAGTGYGAAVMARLARSVVALESDPELAATARQTLAALNVTNAKVISNSLEAGAAADGPYDIILLEGAVPSVPTSLLAQLSEGGRLVAVIGQGWSAVATLFRKSGDDIGRRPAFNLALQPLPGFRQPASFVF